MTTKLTMSTNAAACTALVAVCLAFSAASEHEHMEGKTMIGTTRETFTVSKALDYLNPDELRKQLGCERDLWLHALSKEVCDNSLDNCEEIGVLPEIAWTVTDESISFQDYGSGIEADTVESILNLTTKTSSRAAWRSVTRGAQGFFSKCLISLPYAWDTSRPGSVTIKARGVRHEIKVGLDQLIQQPRVEYSRTAEKVQTGTFVEVRLPDLPCIFDDDEKARFVLFAQQYGALNPHLTLTLTMFGESRTWERTADRCPKWTAANPDPPAWYDLSAFERLLGAMIAKDRQHNTERPLRDFLRRFAGLKRSDTLKAVADETGLTRCNLSALLNCNGLDQGKTVPLLAALQKHGKNPPPQKLGAIGRPHIEHIFTELGGDGDTRYKRIVGTVGNLPFVVEAAFTETPLESERIVISGVNFSPAVARHPVTDLGSLLSDQMIDRNSGVAVLLHVAMPAPDYLDPAKSVLNVRGDLREAIEKAIVAVTADYRRARKAAERDARAAERWAERRNRQRPEMQLCDAIKAVLPQAFEAASGGGLVKFSQREAMYAARPLIERYTTKRLEKQKYFNSILDAWEIEHGLIDGLLRDPRGFLLEPHTGKRIPLGTKAVDDYVIPLHVYDAILYFEKKGLEEKLLYGKIGDRYDCAIMCSEGYAVRAAKSLLQAAQLGRKMKVLCFHDADPAGYNIARTLSRSTGAHNFKIEIIDAGLHLQEALDMGLPAEKFDRKKALPRGLVLNDLEAEYFTGEQRRVYGKNGRPKTQWVNCRRIELNALSADPHKFIAWVESKLKQHGVAQKLVPPKKVILDTAGDQRDTLLASAVRDVFEQHLDLDARVEAIVESLDKQVDIKTLPKELREWALELRPASWRNHLETLVRRRVDRLDDEIDDMVVQSLRDIGS
jgi:hypothetical protein